MDSLLAYLGDSSLAQDPNTLTRKLYAKVMQRIGTTLLPPRIARWRYQRGKRSLALNLQAETAPLPGPAPEHADNDDDYDIPDALEEVIEALLTGMRDQHTVVRWSCAKGVGRITGRLPLELADDVVS